MQRLAVLVIDGNSANRRACRETFDRLGCRVETAKDGAQAVASLATGRFDLVCLDPRLESGAQDVLARLSPGQFLVACAGGHGDLPPRFDGVLAQPINPVAAALTAIMARCAAAANGRGAASTQAS